MKVFQDPLPACFRINLDCPFKEKLRAELQEFAQQMEIDGVAIEPVTKLDWYPYDDCYQFGCDRRLIRKSEKLVGLKKWLVENTNSGHITRQEAVSMVPPCFLDVQPHHKVLDMCASPGSKTCQILEMLHRPNCDDNSETKGVEPLGVCVANDVDADRAYMLVHQCKRIASPALLVTCCAAQNFPNLRSPREYEGHADAGFFDRVLADVPCGGDGTLRKQPTIWRTWTTQSGITLHPLQLQIALRGAALTKVGGLMVYSTCALNPIEDEAVVAELLRRGKGTLELVDTTGQLPGLKRRAGQYHWHLVEDRGRVGQRQPRSRKRLRDGPVESTQTTAGDGANTKESISGKEDPAAKVAKTEDNGHIDKVAEAALNNSSTEEPPPSNPLDVCKNLGFRVWEKYSDVPEASRKRIRPSMFPPSPEEAAGMHLERCMRFLPHDQNTGGFFVAVIKKVAPISTQELLVPTGNEEAASPTPPSTEKESGSPTPPPPPVSEGNDKAGETGSGQQTSGEEVKEQEEKKEVGSEIPNSKSSEAKTKEDDQCKDKEQKPSGKERVKVKEEYIPLKPGRFDEIRDFYGIKESFRDEQLFVRKEGAKAIYYVSQTVKSDLLDSDWSKRIQVIKTGLKIFERNTNALADQYRICQEGAAFVLPYITKRVVPAGVTDFAQLLKGGQQSFEVFSTEWIEKVEPLEGGAFVVPLEHGEQLDPPIFIIAWRSRGRSINVLVSKKELHGRKQQLEQMGVIAIEEVPGSNKEEKKEEEEALSKEKETEETKVEEEK